MAKGIKYKVGGEVRVSIRDMLGVKKLKKHTTQKGAKEEEKEKKEEKEKEKTEKEEKKEEKEKKEKKEKEKKEKKEKKKKKEKKEKKKEKKEKKEEEQKKEKDPGFLHRNPGPLRPEKKKHKKEKKEKKEKYADPSAGPELTCEEIDRRVAEARKENKRKYLREDVKQIQKELDSRKRTPLIPVRGEFNQQSPPKEISVGSDCSGLGSELYALRLANIKYVSRFASECKTALHEIYKTVHGVSHVIETDATKQSPSRPKVEVYVAGPPCQSWSSMGKRTGLSDMKGRGIVFRDCLDYVASKRPRVAIFENVGGLKSHFASEFLDILTILEKANYHVSWDLMNALDNGLPQQRLRVYIVAIARESLKHEFTFPKRLKTTPPVEKFLDNNAWHQQYQSQVAKRNLTTGNEKLSNEGAAPRVNTCFIDVYSSPKFAQAKASVCPCITATRGSQGGFHITNQGRMTTHEELARLQGWTSPAFARMRKSGSLKTIGHALGNGMSINVLYRLLPRVLFAAGLLNEKPYDIWKHVDFTKQSEGFHVLPDGMYDGFVGL